MNTDKQTEFRRYDERAKQVLAAGSSTALGGATGSLGIPLIYRAPYTRHEEHVRRLVQRGHSVLEIGAGTGRHTDAFARTGAWTVPTDISPHSLQVIRRSLRGDISPAAADMEALPFAARSFDVVACVGSLSYGDPDTVDSEIMRVLKPNGILLCVDSLHHNPIYKLNRWFDYKRGDRTRNTLRHMPTEKRIAALSRKFRKVSVEYFGAASFLMPALAKVLGERRAGRLSDAVDGLIGTRRSAFKFVLVAEDPV